MAKGTKAREKLPGMRGILAAIDENVTGLVRHVQDVKEAIADTRSLNTVITTLATEGLALKKPIPVSILIDGEDCTASFMDANISASGDTAQEAFRNLCDIIVAKFRLFESLPAKKLGREPARQLAIMREFVGNE